MENCDFTNPTPFSSEDLKHVQEEDESNLEVIESDVTNKKVYVNESKSISHI